VKNVKTYLLNKTSIERQLEILNREIIKSFKPKRWFKSCKDTQPFDGVKLQQLFDLLKLLREEETIILKYDKWS